MVCRIRQKSRADGRELAAAFAAELFRAARSEPVVRASRGGVAVAGKWSAQIAPNLEPVPPTCRPVLIETDTGRLNAFW